MTFDGIDYAWSHPGGAAVKAGGYEFACRYSSNDASKDISRSEADDLAAHGVWTVVVRETTANRARAGRAAGMTDAKAAVSRATAAGMPSGRPLYFAIDYDAPTADKAAICDYFRGVASVIGLSRTGGYGGYDQLKWLIDAGLIRWVWQTAAWSGGRLLPGRHIYQYARTVNLGGVSCDVNEALTADFGQWMPGKTPLMEDDMPTPEELWAYHGKLGTKRDPRDAFAYLRDTNAVVRAQSATISTLVNLVGAQHDQVNTDTVVAAVEQAIENAVVHVQVDVNSDQPTT